MWVSQCLYTLQWHCADRWGEGCILCFVVFLNYNSKQNENHMLCMMHMIKMIVYKGDGSQKRKQIGLTSVALSNFWPELKYTCTWGSFFSIRTNVHNHLLSNEPFGPFQNCRNDNVFAFHFKLHWISWWAHHLLLVQLSEFFELNQTENVYNGDIRMGASF